MKRTPRFFLSLLSFLTAVSFAAAQDYSERRDFIEKASDRSILYRGRQATRYNIRYDGTPFWESPDFVEGSITLDGRLYEGVRVNVDAFAGEVQLLPPGARSPIVPTKEHVDRASMGDVKFVNLAKKGYGVVPSFYEVVYEGDFIV